jgi:hypothetical protein
MLDLALESTQPRAVATHPAIATGAGADRTSLRVSARVVLLLVEVLMAHLMGKHCCEGVLKDAEQKIGLEVAGGHGPASENAIEDAFVHVKPPWFWN